MLNRFVALAALGATALIMKNRKKTMAVDGQMSAFNESVEVDVPVSTAYNQWTQFEDFPQFMAGVLEVRQLDDTHLHWRARIGGKEEEWDSEITEQIPDRLIAWRSTTGPRNEGMVTFHSVSPSRTRVDLRMCYQPRGVVEWVGDAVGAVSMRASGNLQRFKSFLESRGRETGAWRGTVGQESSTGASTGSIGSSGMGSSGMGSSGTIGH
jgi:uncharacterized membrane protein